ncbi:nitrous oxide reductase family maturation protein NosD [Halomicrobium salinisoli]|uniref:nitrous oxide reductase family maturation protein NosD n=1 Tax=Halomicrobium salinisoli TaxID=2878391 RepID=UPI001CF03943|nr:nitrous oxide reductase family maturation protein NosD [Halomicrobium salinisoli]
MGSASAFVAATLVVLAGAVGGVVAAPDDPARSDAVAVDEELPDLDSFEAPEENGTAVVDGAEYDSVGAAVDAADPGDTVRLSGRFDERVTVDTPNVTIRASEPGAALVDGGGEGDVLAIEAANVTVERVWLRNSGWDADTEDAAVFVNGSDATVDSVRLTEITFGVWINGVDDVAVENSTVVGREAVQSHVERGNGIHLWETADTVVRGNDVTRVRDGIYFSWASDVTAADNRLWDLRYGVHYMYSDDNLLRDNLAVDNDVGYALMVSEGLALHNNTAVGNRGESGHGVLIKDVEETTLRGNVLADNVHGLYASNGRDNRLIGNLVMANDVGVHATAGATGQTVVGNSFVHNDVQAFSTREAVVAWNGTAGGNYWSDARTADLDGDGVSETRHRPAGAVERLVHEEPRAAVFADSPAFSAVRAAEDSFPVIESPGIVDHRPLTDAPHDWQHYYEDNAHRSH